MRGLPGTDRKIRPDKPEGSRVRRQTHRSVDTLEVGGYGQPAQGAAAQCQRFKIALTLAVPSTIEYSWFQAAKPAEAGREKGQEKPNLEPCSRDFV